MSFLYKLLKYRLCCYCTHVLYKQVAIMGQLIQEGLTKQGPIEQLLVGHVSPFGMFNCYLQILS
jgi:hypothetical protein